MQAGDTVNLSVKDEQGDAVSLVEILPVDLPGSRTLHPPQA